MADKGYAALEILAREREENYELRYLLAELLPSRSLALLERVAPDALNTRLMSGKGLVELTRAALARGLVTREDGRAMLFNAASSGQLEEAQLVADAFRFTKQDTIEEEEVTLSADNEVEEEYEAVSVLGNVASAGNFQTAQWVAQHFGYTREDVLRTHVYERALEGGNVALLEWLERTFALTRADLVNSEILKDLPVLTTRHPETAAWYLNRFWPSLANVTTSGMTGAAAEVHNEAVLRWMMNNLDLPREVVLHSLLVGACGISLALVREILGRYLITYLELGFVVSKALGQAELTHQSEIAAWLKNVMNRPVVPPAAS